MFQVLQLSATVHEREEELRAARTQVEELQARVAQLQDGGGKSVGGTSSEEEPKPDAKVSELEKKLTETQRKLKASLVSRKSVMTKLKEAEVKVAELEKVTGSLGEEKSRLEAQLSNSMNISQNSVVNESFQQNSFNDSMASEKEEKITGLEIEISKLQQHLLDQESKLQSCSDENSALKTDVNKHQSELSDAKKEVDEWRRLAQEKTLEVDELKSSYEGQLSSLKKTITGLEADYAELVTKKNDAEVYLQQKSEQIASLTSDLSCALEEKESLEESAQKIKADLEENIVQLHASKDELVTKLKSLQEDIAARNEQTFKAEAAVELLKEQLEQSHNDAEELRSGLDSARSDLASASNDLRVSGDEKAALIDEVGKMKDNHQCALNDLRESAAQVAELESANKSLGKELEAVVGKARQLKEVNEELNVKLEQTNEELLVTQRKVEVQESKETADSTEVETLKNDVRVKGRELSLIKVELEDFIKKFQTCQTELAMKGNEAEQVRGKMQMLISREEQLKKEMREKDARLEEAEQKLETSLHEKEELSSVRAEQNDRIEELKSQLDDLNMKLQDRHQGQLEVERMQQRESDEKLQLTQRKLKAALVSRKETIAASKKLEGELSAAKQEMVDLKSQSETLQSCVSEKEQELETLVEDCSALKEKCSALETEVDRLSSDKRSVKEEFTALQSEQRESEAKVKALETEVATLQTCNEDLNEMAVAMENKTKKLEKALTERTDSLRSAQKCIRKLEDTLGQGEGGAQESETLKKRIKLLEDEKSELAEKCERLDGERKEKVSMLDKLSADYETQLSVSGALEQRCAELEELLRKSISDPADVDKAAKEDGARSQSNVELENLRENYAELKLKFDDLVSKDSDKLLLEESKRLRDENNELNCSIAEKENEIKTLSARVEDLNQKVNDRTCEILADGSSNGIQVDTDHRQTAPATSDESLYMEARRELMEETLKQLKATQPDMWEQEPGIKKLLDKLGVMAERAASWKKSSEEWRSKFGEAEAKVTGLSETVEALKISESRSREELAVLHSDKAEFEKQKKQCEAMQRDCDHLNSALQTEKDSYEQVLNRLERENSLIKNKLKERRKSEAVLTEKIKILEEQEKQANARCSEVEATVQRLQLQLDDAVKLEEELRSSSTAKETENLTSLEQLKLNLEETTQDRNELISKMEERQKELEELKVGVGNIAASLVCG